MTKKLLCIDILKSDVYLEYTNGNMEYVSFTKAKQIIYFLSQEKFIFYCSDEEKSNKFLNSLLSKYKIKHDTLVLR